MVSMSLFQFLINHKSRKTVKKESLRMISVILLNICLIIFVYSFYKYTFYRPHNFPPGPPRIPILGSYVFLLLLNRNHLHLAVNKICKFYKSNIIGMHLGNTPLIVVNDNDSVKKALYHRDFDGRPDILMGRLRDPKLNLHGIFFMDGEVWHEQRRFTLRYLRDFGFGRRHEILEKEIEIQIAQFIDLMKNGPKYPHEEKHVKNGMIRLPVGIAPPFGNCFLAALLNDPIPREDMADLCRATEDAIEFQRKTDEYGKLYSMIPSIAKLFPVISGYSPARDASLSLHTFFRNLIDEQIRSFDDSHERHFIDLYIAKMQNPKENQTFSYDQLILTCIDFAFPALSALSTTVTFLIQQICHDSQIQYKIQREIDYVVGEGRAPTLDDRVSLPYTEACIREIFRFESLVPSGFPHRAIVETEFLGFNIPKGTFVITGIDAAGHDAAAWENPYAFQPERFLDSNGQLCLYKDISVPFGAGKRLCAGETFARNMIFLFVASFLQVFSVRMPENVKPIDFNENSTGLIRSTPNHWVQLIPR